MCREEKKTYADALGHVDTQKDFCAASCTQEGHVTYECDRCHRERTEYTPMTEHQYAENVSASVPASCVRPGKTVYQCTDCGRTRETMLEALGHAYGISPSDHVDPSCTEDGQDVYVCAYCGDSYKKAIDKRGHDYVLTDSKIADCQAGGYTTYQCTRCHDSYTDRTDILQHNKELVSHTDPTCTQDGVDVYVCMLCRKSFRTVLAKLGHNYTVTASAKASRTDSGSRTYTCTHCRNTYTDVLPAYGHQYECSRQAATCVADGYEMWVCKVCHDAYHVELPRLGHSYRKVTHVSATCAERGYTLYHCILCNNQKREEDEEVLAHQWQEKETINATCTDDGRHIYECSGCGQVKTEVIERLGHHMVLVEENRPTCTQRGYTIHQCHRCRKNETVYFDPLGHDIVKETVISATCETSGTVRYFCKREGCTNERTEFLPKTAHQWVDDVTIVNGCECSVCHRIVRGALHHDLMINYYLLPGDMEYFESALPASGNKYAIPEQVFYSPVNASTYTLNGNISVQTFYAKKLFTIMPEAYTDGKTCTADGGFKFELQFADFLDGRSLTTFIRPEFNRIFAEDAYLKVVQRDKIGNFYVYQVVDFSRSCIEVSRVRKNTQGGTEYEVISRITDTKAWEIILKDSRYVLSDRNNKIFFDEGEYRIVIKTAMGWFAEPFSDKALYGEDRQTVVYSFGRINDQYDVFYVNVKHSHPSVLLPYEMDEGCDMFYQISIDNHEQDNAFVLPHTTLQLNSNDIRIYVDSKLFVFDENLYAGNKQITQMKLALKKYDAVTDSYIGYTENTFDLLQLYRSGRGMTISIPKDFRSQGYCRIEVTYELIDPQTSEKTTQQDMYYVNIPS